MIWWRAETLWRLKDAHNKDCDGDAEYVSCEIVRDGAARRRDLTSMVDVDDPGLGPGGGGDDQVWAPPYPKCHSKQTNDWLEAHKA